MIPSIREQYNRDFTQEKYQALVDDVAETFGHRPPFRIAETPIFIDRALKNHLIQACEDITDVIVQPNFRDLSASALLAGQVVPNETPHTTFLQMDFGLCRAEDGSIVPQLIEAQGFPSLYFFQEAVAERYRKYFGISDEFAHRFGGLDAEGYREKLREIIVGDHDPENVILLEIEPEKQVTAIDFYVAKKWIGIEAVCVSKVIKEGTKLYYEKEGRRIRIERIFNRVIFDELILRDDLPRQFYLTDDAEVEWVGHPNWFFRISKHTLPLIDSPYSPKAFLLSELEEYPQDLHNYVLKPLYSFAGKGVIININRFDLEAIKDPQNYILQRKVEYAPVVPTPDVPAKAEVRMMLLWERGAERPQLVNNLVRLSKGEMVGVRYNQGKVWVGGSVGFFRP
ncbi:hypothetical protein [Lewinella sp. LCG006]|uniref:hypothetical protein n=1 Tax=Lewinella sp. LCG006 TaxID=3231911 RepID=UPI00345FF308